MLESIGLLVKVHADRWDSLSKPASECAQAYDAETPAMRSCTRREKRARSNGVLSDTDVLQPGDIITDPVTGAKVHVNGE